MFKPKHKHNFTRTSQSGEMGEKADVQAQEVLALGAVTLLVSCKSVGEK